MDTQDSSKYYDRREECEQHLTPLLHAAMKKAGDMGVPLIAIACSENSETGFHISGGIDVDGSKAPSRFVLAAKIMHEDDFFKEVVQALAGRHVGSMLASLLGSAVAGAESLDQDEAPAGEKLH